MWFTVAEMARKGELDLSRLDEETLEKIGTEALAPKYKVDSKGRRVVEPKDETKKELGRSTDSMDALNLAYAAVDGLVADDDEPFVGMRMRGR